MPESTPYVVANNEPCASPLTATLPRPRVAPRTRETIPRFGRPISKLNEIYDFNETKSLRWNGWIVVWPICLLFPLAAANEMRSSIRVGRTFLSFPLHESCGWPVLPLVCADSMGCQDLCDAFLCVCYGLRIVYLLDGRWRECLWFRDVWCSATDSGRSRAPVRR